MQLALQVDKIQTGVYPQPASHSWIVCCVRVSRDAFSMAAASGVLIHWQRSIDPEICAWSHWHRIHLKRALNKSANAVCVMYMQIMPSLPACLLLQFFNKILQEKQGIALFWYLDSLLSINMVYCVGARSSNCIHFSDAQRIPRDLREAKSQSEHPAAQNDRQGITSPE